MLGVADVADEEGGSFQCEPLALNVQEIRQGWASLSPDGSIALSSIRYHTCLAFLSSWAALML